jgi:hypothetical protein
VVQAFQNFAAAGLLQAVKQRGVAVTARFWWRQSPPQEMTAATGVGAPADGLGHGAAWPACPANHDGLAERAPLRLLTRVVRMDETWQPPASVRGTRIIVTGHSPVAEQLAGRLRELGAEVRTSAVGALVPGDVRGAEVLILLDGLAGAPASLLAALLPLIRRSFASEKASATGPRWLLAAGYRADPPEGLAGLFRAIGCEYPGRQARYVELDRVEPADRVAGRLLGELARESPRARGALPGDVRHPRWRYRVGTIRGRLGLGARSPLLAKLIRPIRIGIESSS